MTSLGKLSDEHLSLPPLERWYVAWPRDFLHWLFLFSPLGEVLDKNSTTQSRLGRLVLQRPTRMRRGNYLAVQIETDGTIFYDEKEIKNDEAGKLSHVQG